MQFLKENAGGIAACLAEVIVGILLLINPVGFTSGIIAFLGALLMAGGMLKLIRYFSVSPGQAALEQDLAIGLLCMLAGLFCMLRSKWFIVTFPVLTILYGIGNLISGLYKAQRAADAIRLKERWGWKAFSAALTLLFAALILTDPFGSSVFLWSFIAVTLIIEAVLDLLAFLFSARRKEKGLRR